jgi:hypothetical protein
MASALEALLASPTGQAPAQPAPQSALAALLASPQGPAQQPQNYVAQGIPDLGAPQAPAQPQAAPAAAPAPQGDGYLVHVDPNSFGGQLAAALGSYANSATLGFGADVGPAVRYAAGKLIPGIPQQTWQQAKDAMAQSEANHAAFVQANPITSALAGGAGMVSGGVGLARGIGAGAAALEGVPVAGKAAQAANYLFGTGPGAETMLGTVGRGALSGGTAGVIADQYNNGLGVTGNTVTSAALGAGLGGVAAPVAMAAAAHLPGASYIMDKLMNSPAAQKPVSELLQDPASVKAIGALLPHIGMTPEDLAAQAAMLHAQSGASPTLAQVLDAQSRANIMANVVKPSPEMTAQLGQAAQQNVQALPNDVAGTISAARPVTPLTPVANTPGDVVPGMPAIQNPEAVNKAASANMTAAREAAANAGADWKKTPVTLTPDNLDYLQSPVMQQAIRKVTAESATSGMDSLASRAAGAAQDLAAGQPSNALTVHDMDALRRVLSDRAFTLETKGVSSPVDTAAVRDMTAQLATAASPSYAAGLQAIAVAKTYADGVEQGIAGNPVGFANLKPEGQAGFQSGVVSGLAQQAAQNPQAAMGVANDLTQSGQPQRLLSMAVGPQQAAQVTNQIGARAGEAQALGSLVPPVSAKTTDQISKGQIISAAADAATGMYRLVVSHTIRALQGHLNANGLTPESSAALVKMLTSGSPQVVNAVTEAINRSNLTAEARAGLLRGVQASLSGQYGGQLGTPQLGGAPQ